MVAPEAQYLFGNLTNVRNRPSGKRPPSTSSTDDLPDPETGHSRRSAVGSNAPQVWSLQLSQAITKAAVQIEQGQAQRHSLRMASSSLREPTGSGINPPQVSWDYQNICVRMIAPPPDRAKLRRTTVRSAWSLAAQRLNGALSRAAPGHPHFQRRSRQNRGWRLCRAGPPGSQGWRLTVAST